MEKEIKIQVPDGYEIDNENSTFECIKFKEKETIKTWEDYARKYGDFSMEIYSRNGIGDKKSIKHLEAELKIKLLMPYYGGEITDEEWQNVNKQLIKYTIKRSGISAVVCETFSWYNFLAFHTEQQRDDFLKYNEQLVKDYLMLDN